MLRALTLIVFVLCLGVSDQASAWGFQSSRTPTSGRRFKVPGQTGYNALRRNLGPYRVGSFRSNANSPRNLRSQNTRVYTLRAGRSPWNTRGMGVAPRNMQLRQQFVQSHRAPAHVEPTSNATFTEMDWSQTPAPEAPNAPRAFAHAHPASDSTQHDNIMNTMIARRRASNQASQPQQNSARSMYSIAPGAR